MIARKLAGKAQALKALNEQFLRLQNWREVFAAYRSGRRLPPLKLRGSGFTLDHGVEDDAWSLFREIFVDRCYTRPSFYVPRPDDRVIDIGANIGFFAIHLQARAPGIEVHSFEPAPPTRERLLMNLRANGLEDRVHVHPFAVSETTGEVAMRLAPSAGDTRSIALGDAGANDVHVNCLDFRSVRARVGGSVQLVKMDIEGAELDVFRTIRDEDLEGVERFVLEYHEAARPGCREFVKERLARVYKHVCVLPMGPSGALGLIEARH